MGIRGLSTYIHEHLHEVLVKHKLHHRKVVIDGNNLAHILYFECTGINAAFGGDYDKYSSFVEEFFKGLQECEVYPIVVMDGGQPLDNKKMNTVRERITNQIQTCLGIMPSNQYRLKVFPCMGRDVFVSTLKKMGIVVLQTDFEADLEIAMLAKELELTVLSSDSDFFMFDVPFILLSSITYNKVSIGKKKKTKEMFSYISCYHFNKEKFCRLTGVAPGHFPMLATLLGNDYLAFDHFKGFYAILENENSRSRMTTRHSTIKNVLDWLSRHKEKTLEQIIGIVVSHCNGSNLRKKMRAAMKNYTDGGSNIINLVSENSLKHASDSLRRANCFGTGAQGEDHIFNNPNMTEMTKVETSLFCKNGTELPHWFVSAYRAHRIPHEVADVVTQSYFISPPQVEEKPSPSCYLLVEPIVRTVYTMLWQSSQERYGVCDSVGLSEGNVGAGESQQFFPQSGSFPESWNANEAYDSDVIVEEDSEESEVDETEDGNNKNVGLLEEEDVEITKDTETKVGKLSNSDEEIDRPVIESKETGGDNSNESEALCENVEESDEELEGGTDPAMTGCLKWYLRKGSRMWIKKVPHLSEREAKALPSLVEVESMSLLEKRTVFYSVLSASSQSTSLDLPADLELILDFIIFWYQRSSSSLIDTHAFSALVCVFMYYIIDGKVGRVRTRKAFEDEEKWKAQFSALQSDAAYCRPGDSLRDTLAQVSVEECLLAAHRLFKFHHMDQKVTDKYYSRKTVHAFSEYQACIYFVQLLNTLLGSPFPLLSIEHLWGGTFCYNIFFDLKKRPKPLVRVSELLGKGSCLEKLFYMLFARLGEILNFKKYRGIVHLVEKTEMPETEDLPEKSDKVTMHKTVEDIPKKTKKKKKHRRKANKKDLPSEKERRNPDEGENNQEEEDESNMSGAEQKDKEVDLLDNRFAGLLVNL